MSAVNGMHCSTKDNINNAPPQECHQTLSTKQSKTLLTICFISFITLFDFTIYIFLSDTIGSAFFTASNSSVINQLQFATIFAAGFIARPIGAFFIGRYGDKKGRKPALHLSMTLLFSTTLLTACLPTYSSIGIAAPILLIIIRLLQGAAFGAQLSLSWVYIAESLPIKSLATSISFVCASIMLGAVACAVVSTWLHYVLSPEALVQYGWRMVFVISAIFSLIALVMAYKIDETVLFLRYKQRISNSKKQPKRLRDLNRVNALVLTVVLSLVGSNLMIIVSLILPKLIILQFSIDASSLQIANIVGMLCMGLGCIFYGWFGDKIGTASALMIGSVALGVMTFLFFYYLSNSVCRYIIPMYALLGFFSGIMSLCILILTQLFPTTVRLTSTAVTFNLVTVFTGVALPMLLIYTTKSVSFAPGLYLISICLFALITGMHIFYSPSVNELEEINQPAPKYPD